MASTDITLLMWDSKANFYSEETQRNLGDDYVFSSKLCFDERADFEKIWSDMDENTNFVFGCHYKCSDGSLYKKFQYSTIESDFNIPEIHYLSNDAIKASKNYQKTKKEAERIILYNTFMEKVTKGDIRVFTKKSLADFVSNKVTMENDNIKYPRIKYAIITALYDDEFEQLERFFEFPKEQQIKTGSKIFYRGFLKTDKSIEVIAAIPNATGMVDSSIIATQMLEFFKPDYLLMSGVCGGGADLNFGDIVLAKQIYTFQKGKLSDLKRKSDDGKMVDIDIFDKEGSLIDLNRLYDNSGNQVSINVEKFEVEHDSIIELDTLFEDSFNPEKKSILDEINSLIRDENLTDKVLNVDIKIAPIACSTMVINKKGYFEDTIKDIHRKVAAVEMESYGVARACKFANNGKTIPLIFKAVMDKTSNKVDVVDGINYKKFAAFTSAIFMKCILEKVI